MSDFVDDLRVKLETFQTNVNLTVETLDKGESVNALLEDLHVELGDIRRMIRKQRLNK